MFIRNGKPFHSIHPKQDHHEFAIDDSELLNKILLPAQGEKPPFVYYYIRVIQEDGHIAWGSPIWIDHTETTASVNQNKKSKKPPGKS